MRRQSDRNLQQQDLLILRELKDNGRASITDIAKRIGISRAHATRKLQVLLDRKIVRIAAFTNPLVLGYRTNAMIGLRVQISQIHATADKLGEFRNVCHVAIMAGQYDILISVVFRDPTELSTFVAEELGSIPSIMSIETMLVAETRKATYSFSPASRPRPAAKLPQEAPPVIHRPIAESAARVDALDMAILRELEADGRQPAAVLARKVGISRTHAANRLRRLLTDQLTIPVAVTEPTILGYRTFAMIGIKTKPNEIQRVADRLSAHPNSYTVAIIAGRYDIVIWTMFPYPKDLSTFLEQELSSNPGIISAEIALGLEIRQDNYMYLASRYSDTPGN